MSKHQPKFSREYQRHIQLPEEETQRQYLEWLITEAIQGRNHRPELLQQAARHELEHQHIIRKACQ